MTINNQLHNSATHAEGKDAKCPVCTPAPAPTGWQTVETAPAPMTLRDAKKCVASFGMVLTKTEDGEFRVNFRRGTEKTAYYATDLMDAIATARAMALQGKI